MTAKRLKEQRMTDEIPRQFEKIPEDGQGVQVAQVPPQGDHIPNVEGGNGLSVNIPYFTNQEIVEALLNLSQAVTTQPNLSMIPRENVVECTMTSRLRDFV